MEKSNMKNEKHRPHVLISGSGDLSEYEAAIERMGGEAIVDCLPESCDGYDALLLSGGNDIDPSLYGEKTDGAVDIDPARDARETALLDVFTAAGKPVFGICRGYQLLNVYFGGTLIQNLPPEPSHVSPEGRVVCHKIVSEPGSAAREMFGDCFTANSLHHQALARIADGFHATMRRPEDGLPEAIFHTEMPWFGVQFHPEKMTPEREETADGTPLFRYFLSLCKN